MLFSLVGDLPADRVQAVLDRYFVRDGQTNYQHVQPLDNVILTRDDYVTTAKDDSAQMHLFKGWFAPPVNHPDYAAMVVLNTILGGAGLTSRLFLELRDKQGLAYVVRSQYEASQFIGLFSLYIGIEPGNRQKALTGFDVECRKLMDIPVSAQELDEAIENTLGRRVVYLETAAQQAGYIGAQMALGCPLTSLDDFNPRIHAVTAADIQRVAQAVLSQPAITSAVGPQRFL
jgi:predicted Zn-dependent peptidase